MSETVRIIIQGEDKLSAPAQKGSKALSELQRSAGTATSALSRMGSVNLGGLIGGLGQIGLAGMGIQQLIGVARQVAAPILQAVSAASDLNETVNKVSVVFGDAAPIVMAFGETSAKALGMSKNEALGAAATYGNLFTTMGLGKKQSADFSTNLLRNAADLASFNNIDPTVVLDKLRAGLVGESEPARQLGMDLSDTAMQLEAQRQGITKLTKDMTQAEKVGLRYAMIQRQMSNAAGDFANTSDGLANSQRIVAAQMKDASAAIGQAFMPAVVAVTAAISKVLPQLLAAAQPVLTQLGALATQAGNTIAATLGRVPEYLKMLQDAFASLPPVIGQLIPALIGIAPVAAAAALAVGVLTTVIGLLTSPIALAVAAVVSLAVAWQTNFLGIRDLVAQVAPVILNIVVGLVAGVLGFFSDNLPKLEVIVSTVLAAVEQFWDQHGKTILEIAGTVWKLIAETVGNLANAMSEIISLVMNVVQGNWSAVWNNILNLTKIIWAQIVDTVAASVKSIVGMSGVMGQLLNAFLPGGTALVQGLTAALGGADGLNARVDALAASAKAAVGPLVQVGSPDSYKGYDKAGSAADRWRAKLDSLIASVGKLGQTQKLSKAERRDAEMEATERRALAAAEALQRAAKAGTEAGGNIATALGGAGKAAKEAGISIGQMISALIATHPATAAAGAAVSYWRGQIANVNMALIANRDQLRAAQRELQGMQDHLSNLNRQLSVAQARLSELRAPRLAGMGESEMQIEAITAQLKRIQLSESLGISLADVTKRFPLLTQGAEAFLRKLPTGEVALQKLLDQLQLAQSLNFDEKLRLIAQAAEGAKQELSFGEVMSSIAATKGQIDSLTGAITAQEQAISRQQGVIESINAAQDSLNAQLVVYQEQLSGAQEKQSLVNEALKLAYEYLLVTRPELIGMGEDAINAALGMDEQTQALLANVLTAATTTSTVSTEVLSEMVANYKLSMDQAIAKVGELQGALAKIPREIVTVHRIVTIREGDGDGGSGVHYVPPGSNITSSEQAKGLASGGSWLVGGSGGTDTQLVRFRATPGERVTVTRPGEQSAGIYFAPGAFVINGSVLTPTDLADAVHAALIQKQRRGGSLGFTS